jgi:hypothetical protein
MNKLTLGNETYYDIHSFMVIAGLKTRASVYNWVREGKAVKKNIMNSAWFKLA